jgi:putative nucleotidyltransferase with HDIG domain
MSTQPLLHESTSDTSEISYVSLQFQGLPGAHLLNSVRQQFVAEQTQSTSNSLEYITVHEIPLFNELREEFSEIFADFIPAMIAKDVQLYKHSLGVHSLALSFATRILHLSESESLKIGLAAFFHDVGKMSINDSILLKASDLSRLEFEIIKSHPAYGAEMLSPHKLIKSVIPSVYHHHERLDGKGYPDGLRGDAIPLGHGSLLS